MRLQIKESQNHQCGACQKDLTDIFEIDHVVALQFGGTNLVDNLMALCCECHSKKSIKENKCRKKIQAAIKSILEES
jgi:5-methylcytosine-specific restriction endonuclease McrA